MSTQVSLYSRCADLLTELRMSLAIFILAVSFSIIQIPFEIVVLAVILGWASDALDGTLGRRVSETERSWVGEHDPLADKIFASSLIAYLIFFHEIPLIIGCVSAVVLALSLVFKSDSLSMAYVAMVYAIFIVFAFYRSLFWGGLLILYCLVAMIADWNHFLSLIHDFLKGVQFWKF